MARLSARLKRGSSNMSKMFAAATRSLGSVSELSSFDRRIERRLRRAHCEDWSPWRFRVARVILAPDFDKTIAAVVVLQLVFIVLQTDVESTDGSVPLWLTIAGALFLAFYILELVTRLFVWQSHFFDSRMNIFDLVVITLDVIVSILSIFLGSLPHVSVLRLARGVQILRAGRILTRFRELYFMVHGLVHAARSVLWALSIMFLLLTLWSVLAVQTMHPLVREMADNGELEHCRQPCGDAFSTVMRANLTFFQTVVVGDGWSIVAVPLMDRHPWTVCVFCAVFVSVHLGVMNLVLTVIVDTAMEARDHDVTQRLMDKQAEHQRSVAQLSTLCEELDEDHNGYLSKDELKQGFEDNSDMRDILESMDVGEEDIDILFEVLDNHKNGLISHNEFVEQLHKMKTQDSHTLLVFIRGHLLHIRNDVEMQLHLMKDELLTVVRSDHALLSSFSERPSQEPSDSNFASPRKWNEDFTNGQGQVYDCSQPNAAPGGHSPGPMVLASVSEATPPQVNASAKRVEFAAGGSFHEHIDQNFNMMLQDALKKVEDQAAVLRRNCEIIFSLNESLAASLARISSRRADIGLSRDIASQRCHGRLNAHCGKTPANLERLQL